MPYSEDFNKKGNLIVEFEIEFPKLLNPESRDFIKKALIPNSYKKEIVKTKKTQIATKGSSDFDD